MGRHYYYKSPIKSATLAKQKQSVLITTQVLDKIATFPESGLQQNEAASQQSSQGLHISTYKRPTTFFLSTGVSTINQLPFSFLHPLQIP